MGEKRGKGKSKNVYKEPMGMDNGMGIDCGSQGVGQGKAMGGGGEWDNYT